MSILSRISQEIEWEAYCEYKIGQGNLSEREKNELYSFIADKKYLPVVKRVQRGEAFSPPVKKLISKSGTTRKRAVYTYRADEQMVLKLMAFMLRDYDGVFAPNLYSFRKDRGVKKAIGELIEFKGLREYYTYKVDISDYFNSVDVGILLPELQAVLSDDPALYEFLKGLLDSPYVEFEGKVQKAQKGIMAGVPISGFLANLYLRQMDIAFCVKGVPYMRYSDDIIVFAKSEEELYGHRDEIKRILTQRRLRVNEEKEITTAPGEQWSFLGFSYQE